MEHLACRYCDIKDIKAAVYVLAKEEYIQNVVFDLYGTLIDIHTDESNKNFWKKLAKYLRKRGVHYEYKELRREYMRLCDRNTKAMLEKNPDIKVEIDIAEVFFELCQQKNGKASRELSDNFGRYFRVESRKYLRVYDGVCQMLEMLKKMNKGVWLLSNAQSLFTMPELAQTGIAKYFDGIAISSDAGVKKPDKAFAQYLFDNYMNLSENNKADGGNDNIENASEGKIISPKNCLMVGNELASDGAVAESSGMKFLYVVSNLTPDNEKEIPDLGIPVNIAEYMRSGPASCVVDSIWTET